MVETKGPAPESPTRGLERRLGLTSVLAISLGAMLGSGIFVLPGVAAEIAGPSLWIAYLLAGLFVLPATLSKAELATAMPVSGGSYVYIDRAFGPLASTIFGLGLWVSLLLKSAFALVGFGAYLRVLTDAPIEPLSMGLLAGIVTLNVVGIKKVGKAQSFVIAVSIASLTALVIWGLFSGDWTPVDASKAAGPGALFATAGMIYISYAGVTKVAAIAEEIKNPDRNLPLGMLLSLSIATILYSAVTFTMARKVPMEELAGNLRPVYLLAEHTAGNGLGIAAAVIAILTMISMANAGLLASSRFPFAMARDGLMPGFLKGVSERYLTPIPAILATAGLMAVAILTLDVYSLAKLASAMMIAGFVAVNLVVIALRESATQWYQPSWRSPLYPLVQVAGVIIGLALLVMLGWTGLGALAVIAVLGVVVFLWIGRQAKRQGVLGRVGQRPEVLAQVEGPEPVKNELPTHAQVVVPVLGKEPSIETLAEMGVALSSGGMVEVVRLKEVPEQTLVGALGVDDPRVQSQRRRIEGLAAERSYAMEFDAFAVHDVIRVVHEISQRVNCEWVVMEWSGRASGQWLLFNPLGWLAGHLGCNLALFKDAGIRRFHKILVLVEPGPHDALIAGTADHLSRILDAQLVFAGFVPDDAPPVALQSQADYLEQIGALCSVPPETRIVRGAGPVRGLTELTAAYDLLLLGAPPEAGWKDFVREHWVDRLTRAASCSVLRLQTPREQTHRAVHRSKPEAAPERLSMLDFISSGCTEAQLAASDKEALFKHFAEHLAASLPGLAAKVIETALWTRERTQNTSIGLGLALPHATVAEIDRTHLAIFTSASPVGYKAPDGGPIDVFFVTIGPPSERGTHLQVLASLSRLVLQSSLLDDLRAAEDGDAILAALRSAEARIH